MSPRNDRYRRRLVGLAAVAVLTVSGCSAANAGESGSSTDASTSTELALASNELALFDESAVHSIELDVDPADYQAAIDSYLATGEKEWIDATVTVDGVTYTNVGLRLKGNSSLRSVSTTTAPESLPWLIRFDKYVDDQNHQGYTDLVVRSNTSATALNEAVALDLLEAAGLASQQAISTSFVVNDSEPILRLAIEHPDDTWMSSVFDEDGALYKAESTGDYSYRGDDPDSYDEVFDQEAGKDNADLAPLTDFLEFINNSDDATFAAELDGYLDVEAFADYLAMMDLVDNFDDIDGPGNNSYLYYDTEIEQFTVVPWDLNLAFGATNGGGGGAAPAVTPGGGGRTAGGGGPGGNTPGGVAPGGNTLGGNPSGSNVLAERFRATEEFAALYAASLSELQATLFDSGLAADILESRVSVLDEAADLIDPSVVTSEAASLAAAI